MLDTQGWLRRHFSSLDGILHKVETFNAGTRESEDMFGLIDYIHLSRGRVNFIQLTTRGCASSHRKKFMLAGRVPGRAYTYRQAIDEMLQVGNVLLYLLDQPGGARTKVYLRIEKLMLINGELHWRVMSDDRPDRRKKVGRTAIG